MDNLHARTLVRHGPIRERKRLAEVLTELVPAPILRALVANDIVIRPLGPDETFYDVSPTIALREKRPLCIRPNIAAFVPLERAIYIAGVSPLVLAHELMHAVDHIIGGGRYASVVDEEFVAAFAAATHVGSFVSPYAATAI